jgi:ABC-type uncharacterized transport system permease subunit
LGLVFASGDVMKAGLGLPTQMVDVINGLVLICIICAEPVLRYRFVRWRKDAAPLAKTETELV